MNILKQNTEKVPTDYFKIKMLQIIKTIKLKTTQSTQTTQPLMVKSALAEDMGQFLYHQDTDTKK